MDNPKTGYFATNLKSPISHEVGANRFSCTFVTADSTSDSFEHIYFTKQRDREREKRAMTAMHDCRPIIAPIGINSRSE